MEFKIEKNEFLRGLYLAQGIADRKSTMPILANVLLRTEGKDKLLVAATDLNVTHLPSCRPRSRRKAGSPSAAKQLHEIVKALPGDEVRSSAPTELGGDPRGQGRVQGRRHARPRLPEAARTIARRSSRRSTRRRCAT